MSNDNELWIEVKQSVSGLAEEEQFTNYDSRFSWQALFAFQVCIRPFEERIKLKWGFSAAFLLEEALDRQKLFIESQCLYNPLEVQLVPRTLAFRCIGVRSTGILLSIIGKVFSVSQERAYQAALVYSREIKSVFPYDYILYPATSEEEYLRLSGQQILDQCNKETSIAQIRRFESVLRTSKKTIPLIGLWQTSIRSDEQIWRAIACSSQQILLNILLRPIILLEEERHILWGLRQSFQSSGESVQNAASGQIYNEWADALISQRKLPWNRFYILQVHLAAPEGIDEYLLRAVGSAITRDSVEQSSSGFQINIPSGKDEIQKWQNNLIKLRVFPTKNNIGLGRLSDISDLNEAHSVFRFPYPAEPGLPGILFLDKL
jgi:hypothetical protein